MDTSWPGTCTAWNADKQSKICKAALRAIAGNF